MSSIHNVSPACHSAVSTANQKTEAAAATSQWQHVIYAGLTDSAPPHATFYSIQTTRNGKQKHFSQSVRILDESLLTRLAQVSSGTKMRVCLETDWNAEGILVTPKDFCLV